MTPYKAYAGIGSRETPLPICAMMTEIAFSLEEIGFTLRSGGAKGADTAFEHGTTSEKREIFYKEDATEAAMEMASRFHPKWSMLSKTAKLLMARNCFQILGKNLDSPAKFVICWTPDGSDGSNTSINTGGTGQALRIAHAYEIPVYNTFGKTNAESIEKFMLAWQYASDI